MKTADLEYIETGLFVTFISNTPEGDKAYNEMAKTLGG